MKDKRIVIELSLETRNILNQLKGNLTYEQMILELLEKKKIIIDLNRKYAQLVFEKQEAETMLLNKIIENQNILDKVNQIDSMLSPMMDKWGLTWNDELNIYEAKR